MYRKIFVCLSLITHTSLATTRQNVKKEYSNIAFKQLMMMNDTNKQMYDLVVSQNPQPDYDFSQTITTTKQPISCDIVYGTTQDVIGDIKCKINGDKSITISWTQKYNTQQITPTALVKYTESGNDTYTGTQAMSTSPLGCSHSANGNNDIVDEPTCSVSGNNITTSWTQKPGTAQATPAVFARYSTTGDDEYVSVYGVVDDINSKVESCTYNEHNACKYVSGSTADVTSEPSCLRSIYGISRFDMKWSQKPGTPRANPVFDVRYSLLDKYNANNKHVTTADSLYTNVCSSDNNIFINNYGAQITNSALNIKVTSATKDSTGYTFNIEWNTNCYNNMTLASSVASVRIKCYNSNYSYSYFDIDVSDRVNNTDIRQVHASSGTITKTTNSEAVSINGSNIIKTVNSESLQASSPSKNAVAQDSQVKLVKSTSIDDGNLYITQSCNPDEILPIGGKMTDNCASAMRLTMGKPDSSTGFVNLSQESGIYTPSQVKIIDAKLGGSEIPYKSKKTLFENDIRQQCIDENDPNNLVYMDNNIESCVGTFFIYENS